MLITAARALVAAAIWRAESEHRMVGGSETLSARAPGQTPRLLTPLAAAATTAAVAVPWKSISGCPPVVWMFGEAASSGVVRSSWESTSAISGLDAVTAGGTALPTTRSRQFESE